MKRARRTNPESMELYCHTAKKANTGWLVSSGSVAVTQSLKTSVVMVEVCAVGVLLHRPREQALGWWWCAPKNKCCEDGRSVSQRTDAG